MQNTARNRICLMALLLIFTPQLLAVENYAVKFAAKHQKQCDTVAKKLYEHCTDMICNDEITNEYAKCWQRSMNLSLDNRLQKIKKTDIKLFNTEMETQKDFNIAVQSICGKDCGLGMKGISYNNCRAQAYKYRTYQGIALGNNAFNIPSTPTEHSGIKSVTKDKGKETKYFDTFIEKICNLPNAVWNDKHPPSDCKTKSFNELNNFEFTDDVCNLS